MILLKQFMTESVFLETPGLGFGRFHQTSGGIAGRKKENESLWLITQAQTQFICGLYFDKMV